MEIKINGQSYPAIGGVTRDRVRALHDLLPAEVDGRAVGEFDWHTDDPITDAGGTLTLVDNTTSPNVEARLQLQSLDGGGCISTVYWMKKNA